MSRKHCPQNFDCMKMGATPRRKCLNFEFCKEARSLGGNQELPYRIRKDYAGNNYLTVKPFYEKDIKERFKQFGWACADGLPYQLLKFEDCPVLYVCRGTERKNDGWASAEELPLDYFLWSAGVLSKSFSEFRELFNEHERRRFSPWTADYFYDVWQIVY